MSSAYNKTNNLRYKSNSFSNLVEINDNPSTLLEYKKSSRSFKYSANRNGDKFSPCLTPTVQENESENKPFVTTLDLIPLYNCVMTLKHLPSILFNNTLFQSPNCQIE